MVIAALVASPAIAGEEAGHQLVEKGDAAVDGGPCDPSYKPQTEGQRALVEAMKADRMCAIIKAEDRPEFTVARPKPVGEFH